MTAIMAEEYKDEYPEELTNDQATKIALEKNFTSYRSDSIDYVLYHHSDWSGSVVVFYDSRDYEEKLMKMMANRLLDIFYFLTKENLMNGEIKKISAKTEQAISRAIINILEHVRAF